MLEIERPKIESFSEENYGKFVVEPLERGYGITLGNSLRRVLISSLQGAAVTHVRIEGVLHEFSTIPGVVEDATEIILNLKKLNFKMYTERPKVLRLDAKGEREVVASDIQLDSEIELLNPDLHVATLNDKNSKLSVEIRIEKGRGYVPAEEHKLADQVIGLIPVDSTFSPITKVNYVVEDTRVGQLTNYDKLIMEVWTDGSILPYEAISNGAMILQNYLNFFTNLRAPSAGGVSGAGAEQATIMEMAVEDLGLSVRSLNCLKRAGVAHVGDLVQLSEEDVMKMKNFGQKSLDEIKEKLASYGLSMRSMEEQ